MNCCSLVTDQSADKDATDVRLPAADPSSLTQSQSPAALLHIVGLEVGRDGRFGLMSSSSVTLTDRQSTVLPTVTSHEAFTPRRSSVSTIESYSSTSSVGGRPGAWFPGSNVRLRFPAASNATVYPGLQRPHTAFCS